MGGGERREGKWGAGRPHCDRPARCGHDYFFLAVFLAAFLAAFLAGIISPPSLR
jgi:hypothetical protein